VVIRVVSEVRLGSSKVAQKTRVAEKRPTVADLAAAKLAPRATVFTPDQLKELAKAFEINEKTPNPKDRLSTTEVHKHLVDHYGLRVSRSTMERQAVAHFRRRSWAAK
jgi:hypothetical protein